VIQLTGATDQASDREITVKDNQKNVIAVPPATAISPKAPPLWWGFPLFSRQR